VINYDGDLRDIRKHLYKQKHLHEKELDFDRGMPVKGKAAFPAGCDMGEKLRQLESRRRTYTYCQETKLVRIVLEHANKKEYGECVRRVLEKVKVKKLMQNMIDGVDVDDEEDLPDNHDRSFSDDWLPSWKILKVALLDEWSSRKMDKGPSHDNGKGKNVLPVAMAGVKVISCYGCGIQGHKKGDPACKAGKFDVHASALQDYKERMAKGKKREGERWRQRKETLPCF
jgi:hypothetical protein